MVSCHCNAFELRDENTPIHAVGGARHTSFECMDKDGMPITKHQMWIEFGGSLSELKRVVSVVGCVVEMDGVYEEGKAQSRIQFLIGDINTEGSACTCCESNYERVYRYKRVWTGV